MGTSSLPYDTIAEYSNKNRRNAKLRKSLGDPNVSKGLNNSLMPQKTGGTLTLRMTSMNFKNKKSHSPGRRIARNFATISIADMSDSSIEKPVPNSIQVQPYKSTKIKTKAAMPLVPKGPAPPGPF